MNRRNIPSTAIVAASLAVLGGIALAAQDRYSLQVPGGLAFSEFRGYEGVPSRFMLELTGASSGDMRLSDHAARSMI